MPTPIEIITRPNGIYLAILAALIISAGVTGLAAKVRREDRKFVPSLVTVLLLVTWLLTAAFVTLHRELRAQMIRL